MLQKSEKSEKNTTSIPPGPGRLGSLQPVHPCPHDCGRCLSAAPENFGWADGPGSMEPAAWPGLSHTKGFAAVRSMEPAVFIAELRRRLGVPDAAADGWCPRCDGVLDSLSLHAGVCTAGSERTQRHHALRDLVCAWGDRAGLHPEKERPGLLLPQQPEDTGVGRRRPADIFVPTFSGKPTAFDLAVTGFQRQASLGEAGRQGGEDVPPGHSIPLPAARALLHTTGGRNHRCMGACCCPGVERHRAGCGGAGTGRSGGLLRWVPSRGFRFGATLSRKGCLAASSRCCSGGSPFQCGDRSCFGLGILTSGHLVLSWVRAVLVQGLKLISLHLFFLVFLYSKLKALRFCLFEISHPLFCMFRMAFVLHGWRGLSFFAGGHGFVGIRPSSLVSAQGFFPSKKVFPCDGFVGYSSFPLVQSASKLEAWATHQADLCWDCTLLRRLFMGIFTILWRARVWWSVFHRIGGLDWLHSAEKP